MIFVGVDIAKLNHFASAISSVGEKLIEPFQFFNDADGFRLLISALASFERRTVSSSVLNQRHTTATTLFDTLLPITTTCVLSTLFRLLLCGKTTSARPRLTKSTRTSLQKRL